MLNFLRRSVAAQVVVTAIVVLGPSVCLVAFATPTNAATQLAIPKSDSEIARAPIKIRPAKVSVAERAREWLHRSLGKNTPRPVSPTSVPGQPLPSTKAAV